MSKLSNLISFFFFLSFLLSILFFETRSIQAESLTENLPKLQTSETSQKLLIYTENYPQTHFIDKNNKPTGYVYELVQAIQKKIGNTDEIIFLPWVRAYNPHSAAVGPLFEDLELNNRVSYHEIIVIK